MNAEVFAKGLEKCRRLTRLIGQNVEIRMTMVAQKFNVLSKLTLNKASLCQEESKCAWRMGYATFVNFIRVFCVCVYY